MLDLVQSEHVRKVLNEMLKLTEEEMTELAIEFKSRFLDESGKLYDTADLLLPLFAQQFEVLFEEANLTKDFLPMYCSMAFYTLYVGIRIGIEATTSGTIH